jgi:hypothetical protein
MNLKQIVSLLVNISRADDEPLYKDLLGGQYLVN